MGVMLQAFYWDCPRLENREHQWWTFIRSRLPAIAQAGFTALWLPPVNKAARWKSMGYDPYDYYDLGEFIQKGGVPHVVRFQNGITRPDRVCSLAGIATVCGPGVQS